jgi:hypothetical protein
MVAIAAAQATGMPWATPIQFRLKRDSMRPSVRGTPALLARLMSGERNIARREEGADGEDDETGVANVSQMNRKKHVRVTDSQKPTTACRYTYVCGI